MPVDIVVGGKVVQRLGYDDDEVECPACSHRFVPRKDDAATDRQQDVRESDR